MHIAILSLAVASLTGLLIACAAEPRVPAPVKAKVQRYVEKAGHLDDNEMEAMLSGRPFVGMTVEEADLAMEREQCECRLDGRPMRATYRGGGGARYYLDFRGEPPRVVFWSLFRHDEIELPDPRERRPRTPLPSF